MLHKLFPKTSKHASFQAVARLIMPLPKLYFIFFNLYLYMELKNTIGHISVAQYI